VALEIVSLNKINQPKEKQTMDYYDTAENVTLTKGQAYVELERHNLDGEYDLFLKEMGDHKTYEAQKVLAWLGY
tara:strand:- start:109 stop:330 length:222 start_codon:yes stop_codon:yes gene_type:complete